MAERDLKIPAARFKAECLKLMDQVEQTRAPIVITKHGRPVAQLAPIAGSPRSSFGYMKGVVKTAGDVMEPIDIEWHALSGSADRLFADPGTRQRKRRRK